MSKTVAQIYATNPTTVVADTDLYYLVQSPYTPGTDAAITGASLKATFGSGGTINPGLINQLGYYAAPGSSISGLATLASGTLITSAGGVPSISQTLPSAVQGNITSLGTIATGVWNGTLIAGTYGGTGVNNGASTITVGGNFAMSGAFAFTGTLTGITTVTFPTSGTLATTSQLPSLPLSLANGGTAASLTANNGGIFYSTASAGAILSGTATAQQLLMSGASTTPQWSTTTYPLTNAINTIMYASSANVQGIISAANNGTLITSSSGVPSWLANGITGQVLTATTGSPPSWASPASSGTVTSITAGTGLTGGTITTTGTIALSSPVALTNGGTAASLTASNGGIVYSTASALGVLAGTATAGQLLTSGASTTPAWTTSTYPATNPINTLLYASSANVMSALTTGNSGVLITSSGGVPSISSTLPSGITLVAPALGTPASGVLTNTTGYTVANLADVQWTDFSGTIGYTGFSGTPTTNAARYKQIGKTLFFDISMTGTSNATGFTITNMPVAAERTLTVSPVYQAINNSASNYTVQFGTTTTSTTLTMLLSNNSAGWTASGTKAISFSGFYETV